MKLVKLLVLGAALAGLSALAPSAGAAPVNLLTNGSFETGDLTGWTTGGNFKYTLVVNSGTCGPATSSYCPGDQDSDGNWLAAGAFGPDNPETPDATLSQTFADQAGKTLYVSGWLNSDQCASGGFGAGPCDFFMTIDGTGIDINPLNEPSTWTEFSFTITGTGLDTFTIGARDDMGDLALDDFVVSTPEPASLTLLGAALVAFGLLRRRRRRQQPG